mmetsp:Transcript_12091/g.38229  ORF Transcript_12091/g.38229 Transcript_12091/m.38229 type:complete len:386 (+) Transcript_12091:2028-3185(+)
MHGKAEGLHRLAQQLGVVQVVVDERADLLEALVVEAGEAATLNDVGRAVEDGAHDAVPVVAHGRAVGELERGRHNRPAEADAGEAGVLGEGVDLDGNLLSARNLVNRLWRACRLDERRIRRVEDDDGAILLRPLHELRQLLPARGRARRVVGRAEVDHVGARRVRQVREEVVGRVARHVDDPRVLALWRRAVDRPRLPHHHGRVNVHRVRRVLYCRDDRVAKHELQSADVALRAVRDEDLFGLNQPVVELARYLGAQVAHALLGAVAGVALLSAKPLRRTLQPAENVRRDRLRRVANAEADDGARIGVRGEVRVAPAANLGEEVAGLELRHIWVALHANGDVGCNHLRARHARDGGAHARPGPRNRDGDERGEHHPCACPSRHAF